MMPNCAQVDVAVRFLHQLAHEIFHVAADVTGLAELRRVRFHKRNLDQLGDVLDEIGFSDAGRPDENDVLFRVFGLFGAGRVLLLELAQIIDVVVMIANRDREDLLRFVLFDDEAVEMRLDVARQKIEDESSSRSFCGGFFVVPASAALGLGESRERDLVAEVRFHELRELGLQFFRR